MSSSTETAINEKDWETMGLTSTEVNRSQIKASLKRSHVVGTNEISAIN